MQRMIQWGGLLSSLVTMSAWAVTADTTPQANNVEAQARLEERVSELERRTAHSAAAGNNTFNPAISLILSGRYARFEKPADTFRLPGFPLAEETGPGEEGFSLAESELVMSANVDDKFAGRFTVALTPENEAEVEEAFIHTLALPAGFSLQAGRFLSEFGYHNGRHFHVWDFGDAPLVYDALLGGRLADDGAQLRWLAPTDVFLELGAEGLRGEGFPAAGAGNEGSGAWTAFVRVGGDVGESHSWRLGASHLRATVKERATPDGWSLTSFTGDSRVSGVDMVWKWAARGNPADRHVVWQAEYLVRTETGDYDALPYDASQAGWYVQLVYQFIPRWRVGVRYDGLEADDPGVDFAGSELDPGDHAPRRSTLMFDFANSEYSRWRLQASRDDVTAVRDHRWLLQYVMSLGAHGAHRF